MKFVSATSPYIKNSLFPHTGKVRDLGLDISKGLAIILVVIGHTIQGQSQNFDEVDAFRFIYSFHMPLFAFLAGAAAYHWLIKLNASETRENLVFIAFSRVQKSAVHLLIPFISWTLIAYFLTKPQENLDVYFWSVFDHADKSLWFLPCIFWCIAYTAIFMAGISILKNALKNRKFPYSLTFLNSLSVQMLLLFILWKSCKGKLPTEFGLVFTNEFHGGLFVFFLLGIVFFRKFISFRRPILRLIPYIVFIVLVPFWDRVSPHNLVENAPAFLNHGWLAKKYAFIVAMAGTLAVIDIARLISTIKYKYITHVFALLGSASLGIYATHFYLLGGKPLIIFPLLGSLVIYLIVSMVPILRTVIYGK